MFLERNVSYNTFYANYLVNVHLISSDDDTGNKNNQIFLASFLGLISQLDLILLNSL